MDKVVISESDSYGVEDRHPDFKPEITVKVALDISSKQKREIQKLIDKFNTKKEGKDNDEIILEASKLMLSAVILDWNIYVGEEKLPITAEAMDANLSQRLTSWVMEQVDGFFTPLLGKTN